MTQLPVLPGTLDVLLLRAVASGPTHGFGIARWIRTASDQAFLIEEGALYPALHRLESQGLLQADWGVTSNNRRAKYYSLTAEGLARLVQEERDWHAYVTAIGKVLRTGFLSSAGASR